MFVSYFELFAYRFLYFLLLLLALWVSLVIFCPEADVHFHGMDPEEEKTFSGKLFQRFYFAMMTGTTIGYGDITPKSRTAKTIVILFSLIMFFGFFHIIHEMHHFNSGKQI